MPIHRSISSISRWLARELARYGLLFALCALTTMARADTQATVVNPQSGDTISSFVSVDTTGAGTTFLGNYLLNGTCHSADRVNITITHLVGMVVTTDVNNQPATVKGGLWEYNWFFTIGITGTYTITVTPSANGVTPAGATKTLTVTMDNSDPGLSLWLAPSSVIAQVYTGKGATPGGTLLMGLTVRSATAAASPYSETINLNAPNTTTKTSTITIADAGGTKQFNNDVAGNNSLPISLTLGTATGLIDGLNSLTVDAGGAIFQRSVIVDYTPPVIDTPLISTPITYPATHIVRLAGTVHDPDNAGGITAPGGIASVEVVIQPPTGSVVKIPARLTYGTNPADPVSWTLDYNTTGLTAGIYSIYAIVADNAGNQTIDQNAGVPYAVLIDQVNPPSVNFTTPADGAYLRGTTNSINFSGTANLSGIPLNTYQVSDTIGGVTSILATGSYPPGAAPIYDTTLAADGTHILGVQITDLQQNTATVTHTVTVDNTPPVPTFTVPTTGAIISGAAVTITGHITDNIVAASNNVTVTITDDAAHTIYGPTATANSAGGGFNVSAPYNTTVGVSNGTHTLTLTATDQAGNTATTTLTVVVINSTPTITLIAPTPAVNAWVKGIVPIKATISDTFINPQNIITWTIKNGATTIASGQGPAPVTASASWDTTATADGNQTLTFTATNAGGNAATPVTRTFQVDNTIPAPTITSLTLANATTATPAGGVISTIISGTVTVNFLPNELNVDTTTSTVRIDGQPIVTNWGTHTAVWNTANIGKDGLHTITIYEKDLAGNINNYTATAVTVVVDNTAPVVNIERPRSNSTAVIGDALIGTVSDIHVNTTAQITYVLAATGAPLNLPMQTETDPVAVNAASGLVLTTIPTTVNGVSTAHRSLTITLVGVDTAVPANIGSATSLNVSVIPASFGFDTVSFPTQPLPGFNADLPISLTNPGARPAKLFVRSGLTVDGRVGVAGLDHWTLSLGATQIGGNPGPGAPEITSTSVLDSPDPFATTSLIDGPYTLALEAYDGTLPTPVNLGSDTIPVVVDNTPPTVALSSIAAFVKGNVALMGTVTDADSDPLNTLSSEFVVDGSSVLAPGVQTGGAPNISWNTAMTAEGKHTLNLYARDAAGNRTISNIVTTTVDRTAPTITITSPPANTYVKGTVTIAVSISDNISDPANLITYTITAGTTVHVNTSSAGPINVPVAWDTTTVADGVAPITVTATDAAGNSSTSTINVAVDNHLTAVFASPTPAANSIIGYTNQATKTGSYTIKGTISDLAEAAPFPNNTVQWTISDSLNGFPTVNGTYFPSSGTAQPSAPWNITAATPEGDHLIQLTATDLAGNKVTTTRTIVVDHTPPTIVISSPVGGSYVSGANGIPFHISFSDNINSSGAITNTINWKVTLSSGATWTGSSIYTGAPIQPAILWTPGSSDAINADYTIYVVATDSAGNSSTMNQTFTVVNGTPSAVLSITSPTTGFDQYGQSLAPLNSTNIPGTTIYLPGSSYTASATVKDSTLLSLVDTLGLNDVTLALTGQATISKTLSPLVYSVQGNNTIQLIASQADTGVASKSSGAQLSVVLDKTLPRVILQSPAGNGTPGNTYIGVPSSVLSVTFQVNKPNNNPKTPGSLIQDPTTNAPIQRDYQRKPDGSEAPDASGHKVFLNAPAMTMSIYDNGLPGSTAVFRSTLGLAVSVPSLNSSASIQGDAFHGFTVAWSIKITPSFSAGRTYRIELTGASDVVGNTQPATIYGYFTVNVN